MQISKEALKEVEKALDNYDRVCDTNLGTPTSSYTYRSYAKMFVRWMKDEFVPGRYVGIHNKKRV
jgi:hypothetical protein